MGFGSARCFLPLEMTSASAPGKIILFGEHAVVYGRPALAVPVTQVHADVEITDADSAGIWIQAPDINLHAELNTLSSDHPIAAVIHNLFFLSRVAPFPKLLINISSTIPVASGLGSGAAVTVALTRALSTLFPYTTLFRSSITLWSPMQNRFISLNDSPLPLGEGVGVRGMKLKLFKLQNHLPSSSLIRVSARRPGNRLAM